MNREPYTQIDYNERVYIERALKLNIVKIRDIIIYLVQNAFPKRSTSTIWTEIHQNGGPKKYRAKKAQRRAEFMRFQKEWSIDEDPLLQAIVIKLLKRRMPVEHIREELENTGYNLSNYTLYLYIHRNGLKKFLPRKGKANNAVGNGNKRYRRFKGPYKRIADRKSLKELQKEVGHLELDMVMSKGNKDGVLTIIDIKTRYYRAYHMRSKDGVLVARLLRRFSRETGIKILSMTSDQGMEFSKWKLIEEKVGAPLYICDPRSPWQRPINERFNGVLRRYFPKKTDFKLVSSRELKQVCNWIQEIRLTVLGRVSPKDALETALACSGSNR